MSTGLFFEMTPKQNFVVLIEMTRKHEYVVLR